MSQFIGTSMTPGYAGDLTRGLFDATIETKVNDGTVKAFGVPVKLSSGKAAAVSAASDAVYGFSVRKYGQADNDGVQEMELVSVLRRGYIAVTVSSGTAAAGGQVYLTSTGAISADSTSNTALSGATFMGPADANGLAEIAFNI